MNHDPKKQYAFKRLETDEEFRARLAKDGDIFVPHLKGEELDDIVWKYIDKQRRIVEA